MQTIFAYEIKGGKAEKVLDYLLKEFAIQIQDTEFVYNLLAGILKNKAKIQKIIEKKAPEWPIDKISSIDRAILEIGVYELSCSKEVPPLVAINEAVEMAKEFGGDNSPKFVNGVLSGIYNKKSKGKIKKAKVKVKSGGVGKIKGE